MPLIRMVICERAGTGMEAAGTILEERMMEP